MRRGLWKIYSLGLTVIMRINRALSSDQRAKTRMNNMPLRCFECLRRKNRRLLLILSLLLVFYYVCLVRPLSPFHTTAVEAEHTQKILEAIKPQIEDVVQPSQHEVLVEPWVTRSCQNSGRPHFALLMIITSPKNKDKRNVIRDEVQENLDLWNAAIVKNNPQYELNSAFRALFFVGKPNDGDNALLASLIDEGNTHGDMIIDDFDESYLNLTVKTMRMLKWVQHNCDQVPYLIKRDDDVYLNVPALVHFIHAHNASTSNGKDLIAGHKYDRINIDSDPSSKWYTPPFLWDSKFPAFVGGFMYVLGSNVRAILYENALKMQLFHLEDVFLTGMVREQYVPSVNVIDIPGVKAYMTWFNDRFLLNPCKIENTIVALHSVNAELLATYGRIHYMCQTRGIVPYLIWI